ncbi:MAG: BamA/TamA family outer membrane protein [Magnetococcales bacterium]|nr:BamA/TamA family outer membrane protein [Magnetococcales bacterium]
MGHRPVAWGRVGRWLLLIALLSAKAAWAVDEPLSYEVAFRGVEGSLLSLLQSVSSSVRLQDRPPANPSSLRRRAMDDHEKMVQALQSRGWFDARVDVLLPDERPVRTILFVVDTGQLYHLAPPGLRIKPVHDRLGAITAESLGLREGAPAESAVVFSAREALLARVRQLGFPHASLGDHGHDLDRAARLLHVVLDLDAGPLVRLGPVRFSGDEGLDATFLARHLSWRPGAVYHPMRLERAQRTLMGTGLFSAVAVELGAAPPEGELWPVDVRLTQRKHRTVSTGAGYSTDKGINLKGAWEHRNAFQVGQRIKVKTELGTEAQSVFLSHETPSFISSQQKLTLSAQSERTLEDAFVSQSIQLGANLLRPVFPPGGEASVGVEWRIADVMEKSGGGVRSSFATTAIPMVFKLDRSDDLLDPRNGWRWASELKPVLSLSAAGEPHARFVQRGSWYHTLSSASPTVLALRGEAGTVMGASHGDLAADQRLYAGGSGTLRGVGYQLAGPLDGEHKPIGGRSLLALGTEVRWLATDQVGLVGFLDAARSYLGQTPDVGEGLLSGAGMGVRYLTPVGPLRFDLAFPLRRREEVDDPFQVYVSIGQAF